MSLYEAYDENGNFTGRWCPSVKQANLQNTRTVSIVGNAATQSRNKYCQCNYARTLLLMLGEMKNAIVDWLDYRFVFIW